MEGRLKDSSPNILQWSMLWDETDTGLETKMKLALCVL